MTSEACCDSSEFSLPLDISPERALVQPRAGALGGTVLGLELADQILVGDGVGDARRKRRLRRLDADLDDGRQALGTHLGHAEDPIDRVASQPSLLFLVGESRATGRVAAEQPVPGQAEIVERVDEAPRALCLDRLQRRVEIRVLKQLELVDDAAHQLPGFDDADFRHHEALTLAGRLQHRLDIDDVRLGTADAERRRRLVPRHELEQIDQEGDEQDRRHR